MVHLVVGILPAPVRHSSRVLGRRKSFVRCCACTTYLTILVLHIGDLLRGTDRYCGVRPAGGAD